ncbi:conserved hypothetical protein [Methanococcus vannielii SB]|jgi:acyl-CoA thioester hydrolase|uniref:Thioesterase superfamily protein n=1 Tax=Methanococcus vannielii (strain ATCC 35089 / DSM 1224 / JCM 13029 / OCM 148 / SB) TaxID=406327 RepID=A6US65_METVS|nr:thioesterase family protein [Methanococcus vannielii]ABR55337.1 conserved hypothetical protein [Methanococcus vannielii SB]
MFKTIVTPRFGDIDGLKHVNNIVPAIWFEQARNPIFQFFVPDLDLSYEKWNLIMVRTEYDFLYQMYYGKDVEIRSYISKIGNTSFTIYQEAWQGEKLAVKGKAVVVHYDFLKQSPVKIPDEIRKKLSLHLIEDIN